jgi:hypothetical protein
VEGNSNFQTCVRAKGTHLRETPPSWPKLKLLRIPRMVGQTGHCVGMRSNSSTSKTPLRIPRSGRSRKIKEIGINKCARESWFDCKNFIRKLVRDVPVKRNFVQRVCRLVAGLTNHRSRIRTGFASKHSTPARAKQGTPHLKNPEELNNARPSPRSESLVASARFSGRKRSCGRLLARTWRSEPFVLYPTYFRQDLEPFCETA